MDKMIFAKRLNDIIQEKNIKQIDLAERTGINKGALSSYLAGRYIAKSDAIYKLAKELDVSEMWLAGFDVPRERRPKENTNNFVITIPFISQKLSAGTGIDHLSDADMEIEQIDILADMARGLNKKTLVAARVQGDSMIDEHINSGDVVIFSRGLINGEGIYVINYFGDVLIKRISYDPKNNTVSIISANKNYPTKIADANDVLILGKVVGVFHIMAI